VELVVTDPLHVSQWGTRITTPEVSDKQATVNVEVNLSNARKKAVKADVSVRIFDCKGGEVAASTAQVKVSGKADVAIPLAVAVKDPSLWSPDSPTLYTAEVRVFSKGKETDCVKTRFGIRTIEVNAAEGFKLNGKPLLLKGGCVHHDNGLLGAEAHRTAEYRRVRQLKDAGFNAVRCAHNPPSRHFLDACDELGLLVIDEFTDMWEQPKNVDDYSQFFKENWEKDLTDMMLRDRNHPSVVIWSIGNEIPNWSVADASRIGKMLTAKVRELDPTRPVTQGVTSAYIHIDWDHSEKTFEHLDIAGYNYLTHYVEGDHAKFPDRVIMGTESYPNQAFTYWKDVVEKPYVIGDFVWTALDHLGEVGLGGGRYVPADRPQRGGPQFQTSRGPEEGMNPAMMWQFPDRLGPEFPATYTNYCGDIDLIGDKKPQGRYRDVLWDLSPLEILVHEPIPAGMVETTGLWGWPQEQARWYWPGHEGESFQVRVFTKAPQVRLEVNGESVGVQKTNEEYVALFEGVTYRPGKLVAISLDAEGKELESRVLRTPGKPVSVRLLRERYNIDNELVYLKAEVIDEQGVVVPDVFPLTFDIQGATFVSAGNGAPDDMASFRSRTPKTWNGAALLIVRPSGPDARVEVTVHSAGLQAGKAVFDGQGKDILKKDIGVGLCSVIGIGADFEDSVRRVAQTGATHVELNNFMGGRMFGLTPEGAKAIFDKYGLRVISDVTMASVVEDTPEYLDRWEQIFKEDAVLGVKYVSMTANLCWGTEAHAKTCCDVLNKIGALAKKYGIQFLYHLHNIEFNPILDSDYPGQIVDFLLENTDPELVKLEDDVFWVQIGGRDTVEFLKKHGDRIPMLHVKDFYFIGEGDYLDYKAVFEQFYANGGTDWVLEMEDPMTRQQMYDKAEGHNRMSRTRESAGGPGGPRPGFGGPRQQPSPEEIAARQRAQNASRLRSLRDIEKNMRTLEGLPYVSRVE
jgi:beta-galactosidase